MKFNDIDSEMWLVTSVVQGSTAANRIRTIGWYVTITTSDGRSASAVFEKNGDAGTYNGYSAYSFPYDYIVNEFTMDSGSSGAAVAKDFLYGSGASGGGTIQMWAYAAWWKEGYSSNSEFNVNGPADNAPGATSGAFRGDQVDAANAAINYTPADVATMFEANPDSRFSSLGLSNGVAADLAGAQRIISMWGGSTDMSDYYPATGSKPASTVASSDLSITLLDMGSFRTGTDVVQTAIVTNSGQADVTPADNVPVEFSIPGVADQTKQLAVPAQSSQTVYFKFTVPVGSFTETASVNANHAILETNYDNNAASKTITPLTLVEQTPPNPKGTDRMPTGFTAISPPARGETPSRTWSEWVWNGSGFDYHTYSASLSTALTVQPSARCMTAKNYSGTWTMKSGYGITEKVTASVQSDQPDAVTDAQNVVSFYPEFAYQTYDRILQLTGTGAFELRKNLCSDIRERVHFTPCDFPDGNYTVQTYSMDAWTPAGMLSATNTGTIKIKGSVFDDYYVKPGF